MNTAIVAFYEVYPPASGAATVSYYLTKYLPGRKHLYYLGHKNEGIDVNDQFHLIGFKYKESSRLAKIVSLAKNIPRIINNIKDINPEFIILEGASWTVYFVFFIFWLRVRRVRSKIIYHAHNVEYLLRLQNNNRLIATLTRWAEGRLLRICDLATAVSDTDSECFRRLYGQKTMILANGVEVSRFRDVSTERIQRARRKYKLGRDVVLFMGLTTYQPNKEAIEFLIDKVFPQVVKAFPSARLVIIGGEVKQRRPWLISPGSIPFDEVPAIIKASRLCVAPIFSGSGTRLKILEYLAAGQAVVTTNKGIEGIEAARARVIIAADDDQMVRAILLKLNRKQQRENIQRDSCRWVDRRYSWYHISNKLMSGLKERGLIN